MHECSIYLTIDAVSPAKNNIECTSSLANKINKGMHVICDRVDWIAVDEESKEWNGRCLVSSWSVCQSCHAFLFSASN